MDSTKKLIPLAALQHYAFCPRQCALIHNHQLWAENWHTAKGQLLHERVDRGEPETRKDIRFERSVSVHAPSLRLTGKLDLLEINSVENTLIPVEYKKGKSKVDDCDRIQVCAQAMCLEEMLGVEISDGAIWYWQTKRREKIELTEKFRKRTRGVIAAVGELFDNESLPKAVFMRACNNCSLLDLCEPKVSQADRSVGYMEAIFKDDYEKTTK
ncbi:CRISPR-associated protein Cas4 [Teredinibacter turnerae]|uniref:CRISPR-associated protein Cas4 n=1 Tax=Teredinibacter turnerae TaxID=2426 RepID=UPI00037FF7B7|nr:CRISPR-associated protein Cas4 [Teredinibacter turnerae]